MYNLNLKIIIIKITKYISLQVLVFSKGLKLVNLNFI